MTCDVASRGPRRPVAAWLLAAALLVPACESGDVGEGDQPGAYTVRVSETLTGAEANNHCESPSLSADGRYVVFSTLATTLVPNDANNHADVFIKDRTTGQIQNLTNLPSGEFGPHTRTVYTPVISGNGRYIAFVSLGIFFEGAFGVSSPSRNVWRFDRQTGNFRAVANVFSMPNAHLTNPSISDDGRYIAFESSASDLVAGIDPAGFRQVWVADFAGVVNPGDLPVVTLVSRAVAGPLVPANNHCAFPKISGDGSVIVFQSSATNLHASSTGLQDIYLGTPAGDPLEFISWAEPGLPLDAVTAYPSVSRNGDYVAFAAGGINPFTHPTLPESAVFRRDRVAMTTELVAAETIHSGMSVEPLEPTSISANGRVVAYAAVSSGEIFVIRVRDMAAAEPFTASIHLSGALPQLTCAKPFLSADGRWVCWETQAANLVIGDTNGYRDIYLRGPLR